MKREVGYYWVKKYGGWIINFWNYGSWKDNVDDAYWDEIHETRITHP